MRKRPILAFPSPCSARKVVGRFSPPGLSTGDLATSFCAGLLYIKLLTILAWIGKNRLRHFQDNCHVRKAQENMKVIGYRLHSGALPWRPRQISDAKDNDRYAVPLLRTAPNTHCLFLDRNLARIERAHSGWIWRGDSSPVHASPYVAPTTRAPLRELSRGLGVDRKRK